MVGEAQEDDEPSPLEERTLTPRPARRRHTQVAPPVLDEVREEEAAAPQAAAAEASPAEPAHVGVARRLASMVSESPLGRYALRSLGPAADVSALGGVVWSL